MQKRQRTRDLCGSIYEQNVANTFGVPIRYAHENARARRFRLFASKVSQSLPSKDISVMLNLCTYISIYIRDYTLPNNTIKLRT